MCQAMDGYRNEDAFQIVSLVKTCAKQKNLGKGAKLHAYIRKHKCLKDNRYIASSLVSMYARCGALAKAQQVLEELPTRNTITWTSLISGYVEQGQGKEALECYDGMLHEGPSPNEVTFICALKACAISGSIAKGEKIHYTIVSMGILQKHILLGNALVDMYARCGALSKAHQVLAELPVRDVIMWTALIAGYLQLGYAEEVLNCFESMQYEGHIPDSITYIYALKACATTGVVARGEKIHDVMVASCMLHKDIMLGSALVDMYVRCGALEKAQRVLDELPAQDVITWTTLIAGYTQQGRDEEALECFESMQRNGHSPDAISFMYVLKSCGSTGQVARGEKIHNCIVKSGLLEKDIVLGSALVDMYVRCCALERAQRVLDELPHRDAITWTALIEGYAQLGQGEEALKCFDSMQCEGHSPDVVTFVCALKACGNIGEAAKGEKINDKIVSMGMLETDIVLGNALVDMYVKCGVLKKAQQVLNVLPIRDIITWNTLIAGYAQRGYAEEALKCFDSMLHEGHSPDVVTFICVLKACGGLGAAVKGEEIHEMITCLGMLEKDILLGNILVDMYARCGALVKAQEVLDELPVRNLVTWNAITAGYTQQGYAEEALMCFDNMQHEGHFPDVVTFVCVLKACGSVGAVAKGEKIHDMVVSLGLLEKDVVLGSALVDMYAKCALLTKAIQVLDRLPVPDVVMWTAFIAGCAQQGKSDDAFDCFERMQLKGMEPDSATFVGMLNACSHSGLLDEAGIYFYKMSTKYGITPDIEHYRCMVDLFGRAGKLYQSLIVLEKMPSADHLQVWFALLGASCNYGDRRIGRLAFQHALHLDKDFPASYVCMANTYIKGEDKFELMRVANEQMLLLD